MLTRSTIARHKVLALGVLLSLVLAGTALATHNLRVKAERFNPGGADITLVSKKVKGAGNPLGTTDNRGWVLALNETVAFPPGASADLTIKGFHGGTQTLVLDDLGFDYLIGSHCTGGSPRFSVETPAGGSYAFGCASGVHTDLGNGWVRVNFGNADVQVLGGPAWPGFGVVAANFLQVLADEGPAVSVLDNILVNTTVFGGGNNGNAGNDNDNDNDD